MDFDHELVRREPMFQGHYSTWEKEARALRIRVRELERALAMERGTMRKDATRAGDDDA